MNTRVLCSSICFIADSVFSGLVNGISDPAAARKQREVDTRDNRPELVHPRCMRDRLPRVLRVAGEAEGLGPVERDGVAHFARGMRVGAVQRRLLRRLGFGILRGRCKSALREALYTMNGALTLRCLLTLRALRGGHCYLV